MNRGLRAMEEKSLAPYDYLAQPQRRTRQTQALQAHFDANAIRRPLPHLPINAKGLPDEAALRKLMEKRNDPDVTINE
jgi:hypothetical protein